MPWTVRSAVASRGGWPLCVALQCIGYGLYGSCMFGGTLWSGLVCSLGVGWDGVLTARMLLVAATGIGCMAARALHAHGVTVMRLPVGWVSCVFVAACCVIAPLIASSAETIGLLAFMMGFGASVPLLLWFESFLRIYRTLGSTACLAAIAVGTFIGKACVVLADAAQNDGDHSVLVLCLTGLLISALCQTFFFKRVGCPTAASRSGGDAHREPYRLSVCMVVLVASYGVVSGLANGIGYAGELVGVREMPRWAEPLLYLATSGSVVLYASFAQRVTALHFGRFIRLSLTIAGIVFVCASCFGRLMPAVPFLLCQSVGVVQGIAMTLLSIEICDEKSLNMVDVMPLNYIVYVVCSCVSMEVPVVLRNIGAGGFIWDISSVIAVIAVVLVIPMLPASSSTAATFSLKELPENETYEQRATRVRDAVVAKYSLSSREAEVFELLVQGLTRGQIAECLSLSSWTVKEYISGIYGKVGVHSAKELMVLVAGGQKNEGPRG